MTKSKLNVTSIILNRSEDEPLEFPTKHDTSGLVRFGSKEVDQNGFSFREHNGNKMIVVISAPDQLRQYISEFINNDPTIDKLLNG